MVETTTKELMDKLNVGDILVCSWGYSMVLYDFFEVVGKTEKCIKIRELNKTKTAANGFLRYSVRPVKGSYRTKVLLRRPNPHGCINGANSSQFIHLDEIYDQSKTYIEDHAD